MCITYSNAKALRGRLISPRGYKKAKAASNNEQNHDNTHRQQQKHKQKKKNAPTVFFLRYFHVAFLSHRLGKTNIWPLEFGERVPQSIWPPIRIMMPSWSLGWRSAKWDERQLNIHHNASTTADGIIIWIVVNYFEWWLMVSDRRIVLFVSAYIPRSWSFAIN